MRQPTDSSDAAASSWSTVPGTLALALAASALVWGILDPGAQNWAVHSAGWLGPVWRSVALVVLLAGFSLAVRRGDPEPSSRPFEPSTGRTVVLAGLAGLAVLLLGHLNGAATQLLGDGQLIARNFDLSLQGDGDVVVRGAAAILREDPIARGTSLVYLGLVRILHALTGADAATAISTINTAVGALYAVSVVLVLRAARLPRDLTAWIALLVLLTPTLQLFLGYVENYTLLQWVLGLFTATALATASGRIGPLAPALLWLLAVLLHVQALVYLPSLLAVLLARHHGPGRAILARHGILLSSLGAILVAVLAALTGAGRFLLGFGGDYGLFSLAHLRDVLDAQWLTLPLLPLVVLLVMRGRRTPGPEAGSDADRQLQVQRAFTGTLLGPALVYLFVIDPELGMARDWDRAAMLLWPWVAMFGVEFLHARRHDRLDANTSRRWLVPAVAISAVATVPWIALNASPGPTLDRLEMLIEADAHAHEHGFEALARYHSDRSEYAPAGRWAERAYESSGNPRLATLAAQHHERAGSPDRARSLLARALERRPGDHRVRHELVRLTAESGDAERTLALAVEGTRLHPDQPIYCFFTGESLRQLGRTEEAAEVLRTCLGMEGLPAGARTFIERALEAMDGG